jgi:penicillin-binding protein 2
MWRRHLPTPIFTGADAAIGSKLAELAEEYPGISVELQPMRFYPDSQSFSHVLGYVWTPNPTDEERITRELNLRLPPYVGKGGIERAYEADLLGEMGREYIEVDARRQPIRILGRDNATPGKKLILSLDGALQRVATEQLTQRGFKGSVVAIDPSNGEVLCLVSNPTFDQSLFQGGISDSEWSLLRDDPSLPLMNRAIQTPLAPGSTFKIVTSIAAAKAGIFDPNRSVSCNGGFRLGSKTFKCMSNHGSVSFARAMEKSCNTYFCWHGFKMGREKLVEASESLGLGAKTEIEIGGENAGWLPNERWIRRNRSPKVWFGGDVVNASIGQGAVATTPLQMAQIASLVANNGESYVPHLVHGVADPFEPNKVQLTEKKVAHRVDLPVEFWAELRSALGNVISSGTARSAGISNVRWGGKTGSAEHVKGQKTHSWFVGFAPLENPKIAICVRVEEAGHGGDVAAPVAKEVVATYLAKFAKASSNLRRDSDNVSLVP